MEEKLDEIIKLLKGIDEKLEVLVNQKVPKPNNSNKAILLKQYEETESYQVMEMFINNRDGVLKQLFHGFLE